MNKTFTRNYPLWIGLILTSLFLLVAVFGPRLAPHNPLETITDVFRIGDNAYIPSVRPVPPLTLDQFVLGTDIGGRDLFSRLLWAVRPTLLLCFIIAALRIILGVALGLAAGWFGGAVSRVIEILIDVSLAVPILLFALAIISFIGEHELRTFILALVTTGWAGTAVFVRNSTLLIKKEPYIDGARALGASPGRILGRHVLPQLWPTLPALISFELAATLLVIGELGFLGLFIGEAFVIMGASGEMNETAIGITANYPELAQMMSNFWSKMIRTPWEVVFVGSAVFLLIFAFNMLGEGLRRQMDITRSRGWRRRRRPRVGAE
ncbi:MAG: ABC transporter permease [Candidatus Promineofilum sp.]|nr:ABC transporter permease [Promineifilum sp.]